MKRMHNKFMVAVITGKVTLEVCLEQAGAVRVASLPQIDQSTRNGP